MSKDESQMSTEENNFLKWLFLKIMYPVHVVTFRPFCKEQKKDEKTLLNLSNQDEKKYFSE
jgi:hypothetical protein